METPTFLFILLLIARTIAGEGHNTIYQAVGSSVIFPAVNITTNTFYDFKKGDQIVYTCHGDGNVRPPYRERAKFDSKFGTFELRNLTEDDSGTYEQVVNMKRVAVIYLRVIEPLKEPTLRINETIQGNQSHIDLECSVQGPELRSMTFLKDGEEITKNITRMNHTTHLTLDACDPGSPGIYTCVGGNPLGNKTSAEVKVTQEKYDCKKKTGNPENWSVGITITIITVITAIGIMAVISCVCFFVHGGQEENRKKLRSWCRCEDAESGNTSEETSQLDISSVNENPPEEEQRKESYELIPTNDPEESGDDVKVEMGPRLPTEEESPQRLVLGHCGQDEKPSMELEVNGTALDYAQVANG